MLIDISLRLWRRLRAALTAALVALAPGWALAEPTLLERQTVPGSVISLTPPPDFTPATSFSGFEAPYGASILVNELPAEAESELYAGFADLGAASAAVAVQGVTLERAVALPEDGALASLKPLVYQGKQQVQSLVFDKWIALYVGAKVAIITYQAPVDAGPSEETLRAVFASVRLAAPLSVEEQLAALPYAVGDVGALTLDRVMLNGASLYTLGALTPGEPLPIAIIAPAIGQASIPEGQRVNTSGALIRSVAGWSDITTDPITTIELKGAPATIVTGSASGPDGAPLRFKQWMLFEAGANAYLRIVASAPADQWDAAAPSFETLVEGLRVK
ncbi:MAG: hypothetical protein AAGM38_09200 [Pseudomonadota bacterium]